MSEFIPSPDFEEDVRNAIQVPEADPAFVRRLRVELVSKPVKSKPRWAFGPAWALATVLVLALLVVALPSVAAAIGRLFGYVPGVGLVENSGNLRMLAKPVSVQRDGVTLTITTVFVYSDHVELAYRVEGVDPANDGTNAPDTITNPAAFCGGVEVGGAYNKDGDARLRLPDGTLIERDYTGIYPKNAYAMTPVYKAAIPQGVAEMTLVLKCIPWARLGAEPENWEVPFNLVSVPAGTVVGYPVIGVNATSEPVATETVSPAPVVSPTASVPSPKVTFTLERVAQMDTGPIFYIRLNVDHPDPSMVTIYPRDVYVRDSQGQKIQLVNNSPYSEDPSAVYEYMPTAKPADGALTLVVEDAVANYAPLDETTFSFDVGENPQPGQTWELNKVFDIAGYKVEVVSAHAVTFSDIKDNPYMSDPQGGPDYPEGSQGFDHGYQFTFRIDPSLGMSNVTMNIVSDSCSMSEVRPTNRSTEIHFIELCRDGYPKGNVKVILRGISVLVKNVGRVVWSPSSATVPATSIPAGTTPHVEMKLDRIVPLDSSIVFYFSMNVEHPDPSLQSVVPARVFMIDSLGQKIQLASGPIYPVEHPVGSLFEYFSTVPPAAGPLTLVVEDAVAYYAPLYVEPRQATPEEMSFSFDAGANPQYGQTWVLDKEIEVAGYKLKVTSARAASFEDIRTASFIDDSQGYDSGYEFGVEADPSVKIMVQMYILSDSCWISNPQPYSVPEGPSLLYTELCRGGYPKGIVTVTLGELSVLVENTWQATWSPQ